MRYIKSILEKFESKTISKVLGFVSKESRVRFVRDVNDIINTIKDFPMSELSDDMISFLRFSKAYGIDDSDEHEYIKFWFNANGNYIGPTKNDKKSLKYIDYRKVPHLTKIKIDISRYKDIDATLYREGERIFAIQGVLSGDYPSGSEWHRYGSGSWCLGGGDHSMEVMIDVSKEDSELPEFYNKPIDSKMNILSFKGNKKFLEDAEFCLVLDLKSLPSDKRKSEISKKRKERQPKKDLVISSLEKYAEILSNYDGDISKMTRMVPRIVGWSKPTIFIFQGLNFSNISDIIYYLSYNGIGDEDRRKSIIYILKMIIDNTSKRYDIIVNNMINLRRIATEKNNEDVISILNKIDELDITIKKYIYKNIDDLSDIHSLKIKLDAIHKSMKDSFGNIHRVFNNIYTSKGVTPKETGVIYENISYELRYLDVSFTLEGMDKTIGIINSLMK